MQSVDSTEAMLEGVVACALEHDTLLRKADMHAMHEAALQAARISAQAKSAESPGKHAHRQLEHVQRMEQTIAKLRQDLEKSQTALTAKTLAVQETQQNMQELQRVRDAIMLLGIPNTSRWRC